MVEGGYLKEATGGLSGGAAGGTAGHHQPFETPPRRRCVTLLQQVDGGGRLFEGGNGWSFRRGGRWDGPGITNLMKLHRVGGV